MWARSRLSSTLVFFVARYCAEEIETFFVLTRLSIGLSRGRFKWACNGSSLEEWCGCKWGSELVHGVVVINGYSAHDYVWRGLRQYHDTEALLPRLMHHHNLSAKHTENAKKQLEQLSFCLTQAQEFTQSARSTGPATKSLQAYYALTALANVEILWKGSGDDCIGRRNGRYNRHGLHIQTGKGLGGVTVVPQIGETGEVEGLFGLWRSKSHHTPHYGEDKYISETGAAEHSIRVLSGITPLSDIQFPKSGFSLLDCFKHVPEMWEILPTIGEQSPMLRAEVQNIRQFDKSDKLVSIELRTTIHPCDDELYEKMIEQFQFTPNSVSDVNYVKLRSGGAIQQRMNTRDYLLNAPRLPDQAPEAVIFRKNLLFLVGEGKVLNEFGYYYVGLYLLGMVTRYHPQLWISELKRNTSLSQLADQFVDIALVRMALLVLSQLDCQLIVYE
ncbi:MULTISPECIES: YaaC family protein [unclassified Phyllobacterium]|uniref:YaaC family protein n=1 Tax=unclassified Phyllobacterium TaxID=2638441 RepID=UPI003012A76E